MSYSSQRALTSTVTGVILIVAYIIYATGKSAPAPENLKAWALAMLIFIGIGIAAAIVIQVLFHIAFAIGLAAKEHAQGREPDDNIERKLSSEMVEDERDKLITLKAQRVGSYVVGAGLIAFLVAIAFGASFVLALHIVVGAFAFSGIVEGIASVSFYEKGVRHD